MNEPMLTSFDELFTAAAHWLTSQQGVAVICGVIVLWAIVAYLLFWLRIRPITAKVTLAVRQIGPLQGEQGFVEGFEEFDAKMRANSVLSHAWSEFDETLVKNPDLEPLAIRNTRSASDYFSRGNVIGDRLNLRFYSALPNLLTGTGILGTFVGLVAGIWLASAGLGADDAQKVKAALQDLLHGASLAFWTSIAGLLTSMLFSWAEKHLVHKLDGRLRTWHGQLESRLRRVTGESLISEQVTQNRQQTEILTQFTEQLAFQIANAFEEKMSASMGPAMERLLAAVEGLREDQGRRDDDALKEMLEKFSASLSGSAGQELAALGTTLSSLNERLESQIGNLGSRQAQMDAASSKAQEDFAKVVKMSIHQMQQGVGSSLSEITERLGAMVQDLAGDLRSAAEEAAGRLGELSRRFEEATEKAREALEGANGLTENFQVLLSETGDAATRMNDTANSMQQLVTPVTDAAQGFGNAAETMGTVTASTRETAEQLHQAIANLSAMQVEVKDVWTGYAQRFESVDESLANVFEQLTNGLSGYTDQVKAFVAGLDQHTGSIVSDLAGANSELTAAVEDLAETLGRRN